MLKKKISLIAVSKNIWTSSVGFSSTYLIEKLFDCTVLELRFSLYEQLTVDMSKFKFDNIGNVSSHGLITKALFVPISV